MDDINQLPTEIIEYILKNLSHNESKSIALTNKRLSDIYNDDLLWKEFHLRDFPFYPIHKGSKTWRESYQYYYTNVYDIVVEYQMDNEVYSFYIDGLDDFTLSNFEYGAEIITSADNPLLTYVIVYLDDNDIIMGFEAVKNGTLVSLSELSSTKVTDFIKNTGLENIKYYDSYITKDYTPRRIILINNNIQYLIDAIIYHIISISNPEEIDLLLGPGVVKILFAVKLVDFYKYIGYNTIDARNKTSDSLIALKQQK